MGVRNIPPRRLKAVSKVSGLKTWQRKEQPCAKVIPKNPKNAEDISIATNPKIKIKVSAIE